MKTSFTHYFLLLSNLLIYFALFFPWMIFVLQLGDLCLSLLFCDRCSAVFCSGVFDFCFKSVIVFKTAVWVSVRALTIIFSSVNSFCTNAMFLWRTSISLFSWPRYIFECSVKEKILFDSLVSRVSNLHSFLMPMIKEVQRRLSKYFFNWSLYSKELN